MLTIGHTGAGRCECTQRDYHGFIVVKTECPVMGHKAGVDSVSFSPDGTRIVSGSRDKLVKIWDAATGAQVRSFVWMR